LLEREEGKQKEKRSCMMNCTEEREREKKERNSHKGRWQMEI
jgi:hypothetical protein